MVQSRHPISGTRWELILKSNSSILVIILDQRWTHKYSSIVCLINCAGTSEHLLIFIILYENHTIFIKLSNIDYIQY